MNIQAVIITGPTASGKTAAAIELAHRVGGEIISCDSMQVDKGMNIGTAKPTPDEMEGIPHHLLDVAEVYDTFSVADYMQLAIPCIREIAARGKLPIIAGGTGLYVTSLAENIQYEEQTGDPELRERLNHLAQEQGPEALHQKLAELDPEAAAQIHPHNIKRVVRAAELSVLTGKTQAQRNAASRKKPSDITYQVYAIDCDRRLLYEKINRRVDLMMQQGLLEETRALLRYCQAAYQKGLSSAPSFSKTALQAIGYKELFPYLDGTVSLEAAIAQIKQNTRNYAKRQLTWFRRPAWVHWVTPEILSEMICGGKMMDKNR